MVRMPHFHCRGPTFLSWSGELRSQGQSGMATPQKRKIQGALLLLSSGKQGNGPNVSPVASGPDRLRPHPALGVVHVDLRFPTRD